MAADHLVHYSCIAQKEDLSSSVFTVDFSHSLVKDRKPRENQSLYMILSIICSVATTNDKKLKILKIYLCS